MRKWLFVLSCFLSACTVGPNYEKKDVFEDAQIAESLKLHGTKLQISQKWYQDFGDSNLDYFISEAINENTDVLSTIEKLRQARTIAKIAKVQYLPMLDLSSGYDYAKPSKNIGLTADTDYFSIGFDGNWEIDIWGKGRRLNEQKRAEFENMLYTLRNVKNVITAEVATTYFNIKTLEEKRRIALHNLSLQKDIFKSIDEKYQAGITDESTYHQASYLLEKTKALIPSLEARISSEKNALATLIGKLPNTIDEKIKTKTNPVKNASRYEIKNLLDLPADIIRTRPDVKAAEKMMVAQNAAIGQAIASVYPNVSLSGLFGFEAKNMSDLIKSSSKAYSYQPSLTAPIFHWGELQNNINLEREKMAETYQAYRKTLLSSVEELSNAITALQKEYQANRASRNAAYNMKKAFQAMKEKYENGLIEYSSLLQVQQDLLEAETTLADSNGAIISKIIAFYKATGGGYNDEK